ncbi:MAG: nitrous oxide reductase accessory protein NosL [Chitinophagales bacterium]|nr:nitrous oxide reductase accessory protein NosL [Chitinophagales bacterium]
MKNFLFITTITALLTACTVKPQAIDYGNDQCSYCSMNIVDNTHASQIVTDKGKQYKYDAIECLVNDMLNFDEANLAYILVADYNNAGKMLNAKEATYLITKSIKSPMGAFLSGFKNKAEAEKALAQNEGSFYNWTTIKQEIQR